MRKPLFAFLLCLLPLTTPASSGGNADPGSAASPYLALEPFVVNVRDGTRLRFMQVKVQLMSTNPQVLSVLGGNLPPLRDAMIMLLAHQDAEVLKTVEGREALRSQALAAAQEVLARITGTPSAEMHGISGIEALYFTDFIVQ